MKRTQASGGKRATAMTIFLMLNGLGLVFMLYVLVNFLKEGRRTQHGDARMDKLRSLYGSKVKVFVAMQAVELADRLPRGSAVIPFPVPEGHPVGEQPGPDGSRPEQRKYSIG